MAVAIVGLFVSLKNRRKGLKSFFGFGLIPSGGGYYFRFGGKPRMNGKELVKIR